jgi:protein-disulfide isomerase-like protein with CxxC motif
MAFTLTFDYLCPFAAIANDTVLDALEAGLPHEVTFRAFSLSQVHLEPGDTAVWDTDPDDRPSGVAALEWGLATRDRFPESFPAMHRALFAAKHGHGRDINDVTTLRKAAEEAALDPDEIAAVVAGGSPATALATDHAWGVDQHRVFGVPTWITERRAVFTRIMERQPSPEAARDTVERLVELVDGWPVLNEFKQTRIPR